MNVKVISAGAGFFGFGALVGWAFTADHFEQKIKEQREGDRITTDLLRNVVSALDDKCVALEAQLASLSDEPALLELEKSPEDVTTEADVTDEAPEMTEEEEKETRSNLQNLIDEYVGDPDVSGTFIDTAVQALKVDRTPPFIISRAKYAWDEDEGDQYDKITLTYFKKYRILVDEDEDVIDDVPSTVGWKHLSRFGDESEDPNVVFIRNRQMRTDFEVVLDEENEPPLHIKYGMDKEEFKVGKAAGIIKLRPEDSD